MDEIKKFGTFGNANIFTTEDWQDVVEHESFANLGKTSVDPTTKMCKVWSSVLLKVVYYETGYSVAK